MKANITSTFSEEVAATMLGKQLPGQIIKQECEPYDYEIPDTGEVITLTHDYEYSLMPIRKFSLLQLID